MPQTFVQLVLEPMLLLVHLPHLQLLVLLVLIMLFLEPIVLHAHHKL